MKKYLKGIVCTLLLVCTAIIGYQYMTRRFPDEKNYLVEDRNEKWLKDIDYLEATLPKAHKNLYFKQSETYFKSELERLREKVATYTDVEMNIALAQVVSSMGDTHTGINIGVEKTYPIGLYWYDEGIYITDALRGYEDLLYSRIISINDMRVEEVANAFKVFFSGANKQWFKNQVIYYMTSSDILKYLGVIEEEKIQLTIEKQDGTIETVEMLPEEQENFKFIEDETVYKTPFYKQHPYENYWYEYLPQEKVMYVNYRCAQEMFELPFTIFTDQVFQTIEENDAEKLVIDLRENQGGSDDVFKPFLKKLKKSKLSEEDKLYVVMGRKTYSSGLNTVINLKNETHAILVGEPSGGRPNHYGDTRNYKLPNSELNVRYSTKYIKKMKEEVDCLMPDVLIGISAEKELKGEDDVLEYIRKQ